MNQVLDELGVSIGQDMAAVPGTKMPSKEPAESMGADADLQARLANLRK